MNTLHTPQNTKNRWYDKYSIFFAGSAWIVIHWEISKRFFNFPFGVGQVVIFLDREVPSNVVQFQSTSPLVDII